MHCRGIGLQGPAELLECFVIGEPPAEGLHQGAKPLVTHVRDAAVEGEAWAAQSCRRAYSRCSRMETTTCIMQEINRGILQMCDPNDWKSKNCDDCMTEDEF